ncbi:MFS transporter [Roseateles sp. SL47]|uniref:MFS transporter n=1 Tax=Roseateles sp. SL47 TaxID=2995138 RepID=UPI002270DFB4|nr:MFS transporter [Roseateles sp. SL47]WAC72320.1 MFS transporter [Roseateles sp. SL47]
MSASPPTLSTDTTDSHDAALSDRPENRLAVRLAFLVAGFGVACWAPLVPFARQRLGIDEGALGVLLLCLGLGSVSAMLMAGVICARHGTKRLIIASGLGMAVTLPLLSVLATPWSLGAALAVFGACLGSLDVAMNVNAVEVEKQSGRPLMSGFHALYSVGGFAGAGFMTLLLSLEFEPLHATLLGAVLMAAAVVMAWPYLLLTSSSSQAPLFVAPRGLVVLLAALAGIIFLVEGAILDWSALLITSTGLVNKAQGGLGFMLFSVAMTVGRFSGDALVSRLGDRTTLISGGLLGALGVAVVVLSPMAALAALGFVMVGLGASNLVPVLFRRAGQQTVMPAAFAVAAVTSTGYAGVLLGPALIGFVAHGVGLSNAFWWLGGLLLLVPIAARWVVAR